MKKLTRKVTSKVYEKDVQLGCWQCDYCGKKSGEFAAQLLGFTPMGWSVVKITTTNPLEADISYDLCNECTASRVDMKQLPLIRAEENEKLITEVE